MNHHSLTRRQLGAGLAPLGLAQQSPVRPNILLILSDDHTAVRRMLWYPTIHTPNLDRFAGEGMRFTRFFCSAPQCVPSRTAYLTGRSPVAARMGRFTSPLPPDVVTLPELFRSQGGYFTGSAAGSFISMAHPRANSRAMYQKHGCRPSKPRGLSDRASPPTMTAQGQRVFRQAARQ